MMGTSKEIVVSSFPCDTIHSGAILRRKTGDLFAWQRKLPEKKRNPFCDVR